MNKQAIAGVIPLNGTPTEKYFGVVMGEAAARLRSLIAERRAAFEVFEQRRLNPCKNIKEESEASKLFDQKITEIDTRIATIIEFNCIFLPECFG